MGTWCGVTAHSHISRKFDCRMRVLQTRRSGGRQLQLLILDQSSSHRCISYVMYHIHYCRPAVIILVFVVIIVMFSWDMYFIQVVPTEVSIQNACATDLKSRFASSFALEPLNGIFLTVKLLRNTHASLHSFTFINTTGSLRPRPPLSNANQCGGPFFGKCISDNLG